MAFPARYQPVTASGINTEYGYPAGQALPLGNTEFRALVNRSSGPISYSDFHSFTFSYGDNAGTAYTNVNLYQAAVNAGYNGQRIVYCTLNYNVIYSDSVSQPALNIANFPGSVAIFNNATIMGKGGGGSSGPFSYTGGLNTVQAQSGGPAVNFSGHRLYWFNWGYVGGGGGGGGGSWGSNSYYSGGGGGAGGGGGGNGNDGGNIGAGGAGGGIGGIGGLGGKANGGLLTPGGAAGGCGGGSERDQGTDDNGGGGGGGRIFPGDLVRHPVVAGDGLPSMGGFGGGLWGGTMWYGGEGGENIPYSTNGGDVNNWQADQWWGARTQVCGPDPKTNQITCAYTTGFNYGPAGGGGGGWSRNGGRGNTWNNQANSLGGTGGRSINMISGTLVGPTIYMGDVY